MHPAQIGGSTASHDRERDPAPPLLPPGVSAVRVLRTLTIDWRDNPAMEDLALRMLALVSPDEVAREAEWCVHFDASEAKRAEERAAREAAEVETRTEREARQQAPWVHWFENGGREDVAHVVAKLLAEGPPAPAELATMYGDFGFGREVANVTTSAEDTFARVVGWSERCFSDPEVWDVCDTPPESRDDLEERLRRNVAESRIARITGPREALVKLLARPDES